MVPSIASRAASQTTTARNAVGSPQTGRLDQAGDAADPVTLPLQLFGLLPEAACVDLLAAEAVQHAQPTDDVDDPARQNALPAAIGGADVLQPTQRGAQDQRQGRHPGQHHHRQQHRHLQQQGRDHHVGQDGPHPRPGHRETAADRPHVTDADGHHLPGASSSTHRGAEPCGLVGHGLDRAESGIHAHPRHRAVSPDPQAGQHGPRDHQGHRPPKGNITPARGQPVDRAGEQVRGEHQTHHPSTAQHRPERHPSPLSQHQPRQVRPRTPRRRDRAHAVRETGHEKSKHRPSERLVPPGPPSAAGLRGAARERALGPVPPQTAHGQPGLSGAC